MNFVNTFNKGSDRDTDKRFQQNDGYRQAQNMSLTGDTDFFSLKNIKSSRDVATLVNGAGSPNYNILAAVDCIGTYPATTYPAQTSEERNDSVMVFVASNSAGAVFSAIYLVDVVRNFVHLKIQEFDPNDNLGFPKTGTVDAFVFGEGGIDNVYATDDENPFLKVPATPDAVSDYRELTLQRYAPLDKLSVLDVQEGGSLLAGTYQFAYRYFNSQTGIYSTWSLLTNPCPIYPGDLNPDDYEKITGGLPGEPSNKTIRLQLFKASSTTDSLYDCYQLAVVKNIIGSRNTALTASLTAPEAYGAGANPIISYDGTGDETEVDISDIVIDDAPVKTAKTITTKDNVMLAGNIQYHDLEVGDLTFSNAESITRKVGIEPVYYRVDGSDNAVNVNYGGGITQGSTDQGYKNPLNTVDSKGYFRDEEYRFATIYMDEYGNWSTPKVFDFSQYNAKIRTGNSYAVVSTAASPNSGGATIVTVAGDITAEVEPGDSIDIQSVLPTATTYYGLMVLNSTFGGVNTEIEIEGVYTVTSGTVFTLLGGEYSYSTSPSLSTDPGTDWKFPKRKNAKFSILSSDLANSIKTGQIQALGLKISGLTDHPEWAKALSIVRVKRIKETVGQSIHVPSIVAQPNIYNAGSCTVPEGANFIGTYDPKRHAQSAARNIFRDAIVAPTTVDYYEQDFAGIATQGWEMTFGLIPEFHYNQSGEKYIDYFFNDGQFIETVDAVSMFMTPQFDTNGLGVDAGGLWTDSSCFILRADSKWNYYFQEDSDNFGKGMLQDPLLSDIAPNVLFNELDDGEYLAYNNGFYSFLTTPDADNAFGKRINKFHDLDNVSQANFGNTVIPQEGGIYLLDTTYADASWLSARKDQTGDASYPKTPIEFNNDSGDANRYRYNIDLAAFRVASDPDNTYTDWAAGAVSTSFIFNLKVPQPASRYGEMEQTYEFIQTGVYEVITDPTDSFDLEVFGGDCFISKSHFKVNDTVLGIFDGLTGGATTCNNGDNTVKQVRAYANQQEILSYYVESEINCSLQTQRFISPVSKDKSLFIFSKQYTYDYNFGYSVQNEAKTWFTLSKSDEPRNDFPSRIIYSDRKVYQGNIEGFDRYRVTSFYDLPETDGDLTKLVKLNNDNVYSIQEDVVTILPINKRIIEDADGGQLAISTDTFITTPFYVLQNNGSQHIRTVKNSHDHIFFVDARRREVLKLGGSGQGKISDIGQHTYFEEKLDFQTEIQDRFMFAGYDYQNEEYLFSMMQDFDTSYNDNLSGDPVVKDMFTMIWSDKINSWTSNLVVPVTSKIMGYINSGKKFYMLGERDLDLVVERMYDDDTRYGYLMGGYTNSTVELIVNPEPGESKTFDVLKLDSSNRWDTVTMTVEKEIQLGDSLMPAVSLNIVPREDFYIVATIRDQNNARMRGRYAVVNFELNNGVNTPEVSFNKLLTDYRVSSKRTDNRRR